MRKALLWTLILLSILVLIIRYSSKISEVFFGVQQKSGISISSNPEGARVFLDEKEAGTTPFEDKNLEVKEINVKLDKDGATWQSKVKLTPQTLTIINRDLAVEQASQSGEILTLDKGRGITVVSNPQDAEIEIDGKVYGKTPININLQSGEHLVSASHPNYLKRSLRVSLPENFNLTIALDLAISEADLTSVSAPVITQTPELTVKETPTGFLRVRDKPSVAGKEITQVKPGDTLILLEELSGWDRVRLSDGTEGFVSSTYVEKKSQ